MSNARDKANIPALNFSSKGIDDNATSTAITIDSNGKAVLGKTTVDSEISKLQLFGTSPGTGSGGQLGIQGSETTGAINTGGGIAFKGHNGLGNRNFGDLKCQKENSTVGSDLSYMSFATRNASGVGERMRIESDGKVLVNTTSNGTESNLNVNGQFGLSSSRGFIFEKQDGTNASGITSVTLQFTTGANGRTCFIESMVGSNAYYLYHVSHRYRGEPTNVLVNQGNGPTVSWSVTNTGSNSGSVYTYVVTFPAGTFFPYAKFKVALGGQITTPITSPSITFA